MSDFWMQTSTGAAIDVLDPDPATLRLIDIAIMLARIPRFTGGTRPDISVNVAEHSVLVEQLAPVGTVPLTRLHLLFHDAHEMITGDVATPLKKAYIDLCGGSNPVGIIQNRVQRAIEMAAGMWRPTPGEADLIKRLDLEALAIEKRDCMADEPKPWSVSWPDISKQAIRMLPGGATRARKQFMFKAYALIKDAGVTPLPTFMEGGLG